MVNPKGNREVHKNCNCIERKEGRCQSKGLFVVKGIRHNCFPFKTEAAAKEFLGIPVTPAPVAGVAP
jgi:hypothetical protein